MRTLEYACRPLLYSPSLWACSLLAELGSCIALAGIGVLVKHRAIASPTMRVRYHAQHEAFLQSPNVRFGVTAYSARQIAALS